MGYTHYTLQVHNCLILIINYLNKINKRVEVLPINLSKADIQVYKNENKNKNSVYTYIIECKYIHLYVKII